MVYVWKEINIDDLKVSKRPRDLIQENFKGSSQLGGLIFKLTSKLFCKFST